MIVVQAARAAGPMPSDGVDFHLSHKLYESEAAQGGPLLFAMSFYRLPTPPAIEYFSDKLRKPK